MKTIEKLYYDTASPSAFTTARNVYGSQVIKKKRYSKRQVEEWVKRQSVYSLFRPVIRKFKRNSYYLLGINDLFQADLMDLPSYSSANDGFKHILVIIDCFSKFCWCIPCRRKTSAELCLNLSNFFTNTAKPRNFMTDKGFISREMDALMKKMNVTFYVAQNPDVKASFAERVIRTLKSKMFKMMAYRESRRYIDDLQKIVNGYNHTVHRSTGLRPVDVNISNESDVRDRLNRQVKKEIKKQKLLKVGDAVRISKEKAHFAKGYSENWTREVFYISEAIETMPIVMYKLRDEHNENIIGSFYRRELQLVEKQLL